MSDTFVIHVVDDDPAARDSLQFTLSTAGWATRVYESAASLLERAEVLESGVVITDVRMPGMNGLELVERLKRLRVAHPVIVLTGHADVSMVVDASARWEVLTVSVSPGRSCEGPRAVVLAAMPTSRCCDSATT